jgi:hypothetical protein
LWTQKRKGRFQTPLPFMPSKGRSGQDDQSRESLKHPQKDRPFKNQT